MFDTLVPPPCPSRRNEIASADPIRADLDPALAQEMGRLLSAALRDTSESILISDACLESPGPHIVFVNAAFTRMTGYEPGEVLGKTPRILQGPLTDRSVMERLKADLRASQPFKGETTNYRKDGTAFLMQWRISAVLDDVGLTTHYVAVQRDVTVERQREQELRNARQSAEAAARAKSEFLAVMSHEIRTPMNGVLGMTSILAETSLTPDQRDCLDTIRSSGDALLSIINDILDFSKMEAGGMDLEAIPFDLLEMAEVAADLVVPQGQDKGLELILEMEPDLPRVVGDPGRIRQVLLNLLTNAIKFTSTGEIRLSIKTMERSALAISITVEVCDTGIGIPADDQQRLFSPFMQADSSTTRRYGGTGLGLAICKRMIELMGGAIGFESRLGQGSRFWFTLTLPLAAVDSEPVASALTVECLRGKRALVVDDNATNRKVLRHQLETAGLEVVEASSGGEALAELMRTDYRKAFDLALLDLHMPGIDGLMLARSIRQTRGWTNLPLVMLASHRDRQSMLEARQSNISEYLLKPVSSRRLLQMLLALLETERPPQPPQLALPVSREPNHGLVLVVEDNGVNQRIARMMLERLGFRVDTVANGLEAVSAHSRSRYTLILMDCQMPEMDGWEATRLIRQNERKSGGRTPILALTAAVMEDDRQRCIEADMDDFLTKPIRFSELQTSVAKWLQLPEEKPFVSASA